MRSVTVPAGNAFTLAACAEMIYLDKPFMERVEAIAARGLGVEIWGWTAKDLQALAARRADGARIMSMTGYIEGDLTTSEGIARLLETAEQSLAAAETLECPVLNFHGTGLGEGGIPVVANAHPTPGDWLRAAETCARLARLGAREGRVFTLENLNTALDHPGCPFATAADALALVRAVDSPHLRLNLDLYHAQIGEGNLIELCRQALPWIGELQVADVPGRAQPGTGEINYRAIVTALADMGYHGNIGMEAFAWGATDADEPGSTAASEGALDQFITTFTVGGPA
ncbi:TIM barrel protein [Actinomyces gaoshouyii]|uniref:Hydroxypyruvate isomerase n=1 Tax=Actinomyces gaoshouyii TaxID=1960083 RepID=A0A8H9HC78_9ACTO|nr:TIM barrel protein [Actinomyces gaoshouyii]GGO97076.1 hydroxypyruvate isomerase [Actinomyces gaoshouyii]